MSIIINMFYDRKGILRSGRTGKEIVINESPPPPPPPPRKR
jgi:hypothetical protein